MAMNDKHRVIRRIARIAGWTIGLALAVSTVLVCAAILYARTDRGRATVR